MGQDKAQRDPKSLPIVLCNGFSPIPHHAGIGPSYYADRGWKVFVVPYSGKAMRDAEVFAALVNRCLRGALIQCGAKQAHIVAHSMGGVAGCVAAKRLGAAKHIANFVSFGSPYHGTNVAKFMGTSLEKLLKLPGLLDKLKMLIPGIDLRQVSALSVIELAKLTGFGTMAEQILENSDFLRQLHTDPLPTGPRFVSLAGTNDIIVTPGRTALDGALLATGPYGHEDFLISSDLHRWMESFLT